MLGALACVIGAADTLSEPLEDLSVEDVELLDTPDDDTVGPSGARDPRRGRIGGGVGM